MNKTTWATLLAMVMTAAASADEPAQIAFETADKNGDGRVNREEASIIAGFDFSRADTNLDASLSRPEYQAALGAPSRSVDTEKAPRTSDITAKAQRTGDSTAGVSFETTDKNKDGRVNRKEASDIPGFDFSAADTNDDASLSRHEFRVALTGSSSRGS